MDFMKLLAFAVVSAILIVLLRQNRPEQGLLLSLLAAAILLLWLLEGVAPILEELQQLVTRFSFGAEKGQVLFKTLGICFLTQTAADVCRDAGEGSLAGKIELAGKLAVLLLCMPLFQSLLDIAAGLIR